MLNRIWTAGIFRSCLARKRARQCGLTIVEGIGMIVLVGIMAGMAVPAIGGLKQAGQDQQAIGIAQALNQAQQTYQLRVANAVASWSAATGQESKYALISAYVPYAADTLADYSPTGYSFQLGSTLGSKVTISGPNGPVSY
jgi:type II secretory pathway pseudopilin PulG